MFLIFDTETTGLPKDFNAPVSDSDNWPRVVQLAWQMHDAKGELIGVKNYIIKPDGFSIPFMSQKIHGISTERAEKQGRPLQEVIEEFEKDLKTIDYLVGHNLEFDLDVTAAEHYRLGFDSVMLKKKVVDTKEASTDFCQIPGGRGGKFKWPKLEELHTKLFGKSFDAAHNAAADVEATTRCFLELIRLEVIAAKDLGLDQSFTEEFIGANPKPIKAIGLNIEPFGAEDFKPDLAEGTDRPTGEEVDIEELQGVPFTHLHNHTQYSILQSTTDITKMVEKAYKEGMPAVAITDTSNLMGAFHFVNAVEKINKNEKHRLKAIVGVELNVCKDRLDRTRKDNGYLQVFLAKNKKGYHNLAKLSSAGYIEGFYYVPRIDKQILQEHKGDFIALTGGLKAEIPDLILNHGVEQAEEAFRWWKEQFGDDFYVELNRHGLEEEEVVNQTLLEFAKKYDVKVIAANNTFYLDQKDSVSHDIMLCVKEGEKRATEVGRGRGKRFGFPNDSFYFKGTREMKELFADIPEAIINTNEIVDKVEPFILRQDVLLPKFDFPEEFKDPEDEKDGGNRGENAYLRHLTYEGAKLRYPDLTDEIKERLDFELETIRNSGYPGYFLIVQDFIAEARRMGVSVGPGRGSAAGSAVAYCLKITNIDPIKYDLLFERFLNPERISMPDIDIDFDDRGRGKVIDWVVNKYGAEQVAQIITYGTMAAKSSIRDTGRVLDLPLPDTDRVAKLVPDVKLKELFSWDKKERAKNLNKDLLQQGEELVELAGGSDLTAEVINQARALEGSVRNTGIHACGVIITPSDIREHIPVAVSKDSELWCTQFDNSVVEDAGLLKMDFLGLKNLTILQDAVEIIKERHGIEIDPDEVPLDDKKTYELFQRGDTIGIFQYESPGMSKHLKDLKPDKFEDLIAMNALYRPGPLKYIPEFIERKHGTKEIQYDLPIMESYLKDTYGITVYQEQVMLLSQELAGFSKGQADALRKGMGKKKKDVIDAMWPLFLEGCTKNGHPEDKVKKIWEDWEDFASYAFNKSHSTCYAFIAFQTAYLKANYTPEYMAALLTNNMNDIKEVSKFMEACKQSGVEVLGPDLNESNYYFTVNKEGQIRFGLGAIKGVGRSAVEAIIEERNANGLFTSVFDVTKRVDLRSVNKKTFEGLIIAGALDEFEGVHRGMFFAVDESGQTFLEKMTRFGAAFQESKNGPPNLFGDTSDNEVKEPAFPDVEPWPTMESLRREKEVVGMYISGHPLDAHKFAIQQFCNTDLTIMSKPLKPLVNQTIRVAGIVQKCENRVSKTGKPFGFFELEDFDTSHRFALFGEDYAKFKIYMVEGTFVWMKATVVYKEYRKSYELAIQDMCYLTDVMSNLTKKLSFKLPLEQVNENHISSLKGLIQDHKGKVPFHVTIVAEGPEGKPVAVKMLSKSYMVSVTEELVQDLNNLKIGDFRLN